VHYFCKVAWFISSGNANSQNNRYWYSKNQRNCVFWQIKLLPLNSKFFLRNDKKKKECTVTSCMTLPWPTQQTSIPGLEDVFGKGLITHILWPPVSQDLNLCKYYLWVTLKDTVYVNKPYSLQEMKYVKTNCKYFMIRNMTCVEIYFQKLQGLLRSRSLIKSQVNWTAGEKTDSKFPAHTSLLCDVGPVAAFMLSKVIRDQWHTMKLYVL
jgi:hypothetical protein